MFNQGQQAEQRLPVVDSRLLSTAFNLQGEWVCPECAAGKAPPPRRAATARERFLQQQGLALARIEAIWQVRLCGFKQVAVRALPVCRLCMSLLASAEGPDSSYTAAAWLHCLTCLTVPVCRRSLEAMWSARSAGMGCRRTRTRGGRCVAAAVAAFSLGSRQLLRLPAQLQCTGWDAAG